MLIREPYAFNDESDHMKMRECFVVIMYSKSCGLERVNEARVRLFTSGKKSLDALPPTQASLYQHIRRAVLQAFFIWGHATIAHQDIPDFSDWDWRKDITVVWVPFWTTLGDSSKACSILMQCCSVKSYTGKCKCSRTGVHCANLCANLKDNV